MTEEMDEEVVEEVETEVEETDTEPKETLRDEIYAAMAEEGGSEETTEETDIKDETAGDGQEVVEVEPLKPPSSLSALDRDWETPSSAIAA